LVRSTRGAHPIPRRQAILLIVAVALPWLANIEYSFGRHTLWPFDPAPIAYTISGAIIAIGLWRLGLFELVLAARQVLIEQMEDGWIVTDREGRIVDVNRAACQILGVPGPGQVIGRTVAEILPLNSSMVQDPTSIALPAPEGNRYYDVRRAAVRDHAGRHAGELLVLREISERVRFEEEQARLIADLNAALAQVKKLSGLLPICAICKKIRNDAGYWTEVEEYIASHSEADFTHGICPECMARYYPELLEEEPASRETDP
ncbi:MAG: PAS domain-containing protein, partial [Chloroflexi bacterium]|nr:PAS domain-containing protein [Chloroflexota bacterium]